MLECIIKGSCDGISGYFGIMGKLVSIVLPTYNGARTVCMSIDSVLSQTYTNWELIIVDDCSVDDTFEIVDRYSRMDERITVIHNEQNQNLPTALNTGFDHAKGEYLTWTSDDNAYLNNAIGVMAEHLDNAPGVDMVYSDMEMVDENGEMIRHFQAGEPGELRWHNMIGACFMYRKGLASKIGQYDADMFMAEDYEYWIRAYLNGTLFHIPEVLYKYGINENSLSATRREESVPATFAAKNKHFDDLYKRCTNGKERRRFLYEMLALMESDEKRKQERKKYYRIDRSFALADRLNMMKRMLNDRIRK